MKLLDAYLLWLQLRAIGQAAKRTGQRVPVDIQFDSGGGVWSLNAGGLAFLRHSR